MAVSQTREIEHRSSFKWLAGSLAVGNIALLSRHLRKRIVDEAAHLSKSVISEFTPWLAYLSRCEKIPADLKRPAYQTVISAPDRLRSVQTFVEGNDGYFDLSLEPNLAIKIDFATAQNPEIFRERFLATQQWLWQSVPWLEDLYRALAVEVLPVTTERSDIDRIGLSSHLVKGAMFFMMSKEDSEYRRKQMAMDLAHELGHQVLITYLSSDRILTSSHTAPVFSGARNETRGAIKSFHGAVALSYEKIACTGLLTHARGEVGPLLERDWDRIDDRLRKNIQALIDHCTFTTFGSTLLSEIQAVSRLERGDILT